MSNNSENNSTITVKREEPISLPANSQERRIAIRYPDWERCKKSIAKVRKDTPRLDLVFSFLFGITATSGVSLLTFNAESQTNLSVWTFPIFRSLCGFSFFSGVVFFFMDRYLRKNRKSQVDDILEDMNSVEKIFQKE